MSEIRSDSASCLDRQALLNRARRISERANELAATTTGARQIPDEIISALHKSELFRLLQPARYGGLEAELVDIVDITEALARGCGSAGWVYAVFTSHVLTLTSFPEQAQDEVWGINPNHVASSSYSSLGKLVPERGGFRLNGRWSYLSGIDFAQWCILATQIGPDKSNPPITMTCLVPVSDVKIVDDWRVLGMAGTGSKSITATDLFVPQHRAIAFLDAVRGATHGARLHAGPLYRCPRFSCASYGLAGAILGIASGFLDRFVDYAVSRSGRPLGSGTLADSTSSQLKLAESACEVDAARLLLRRSAIETHATLAESGTLPDELRARNRRDHAFACKLCVSAVDRLFAAAGAAAILESCPLLLPYRDIHSGAGQIAFNFEAQAQPYGGIRMGFPPNTPLL